MSIKTYDIAKLEASGKFDTAHVQRFFYNVKDYYEVLTDFFDNYKKCLGHYTPVFVVNSEEDRQRFLTECSQVRAKFINMGAIGLLDALSVLEDAAIIRNFEQFSDGQVKFNATLKIYMDLVKSVEVKTRAQSPKTKSKTPIESKPKKKKRTIMVVDPLINELQEMMVVLSDNYNVIGCSDSQSAMASLSARKPDLFLVCVKMDGITGYELAFLIRRKGQKAPIWFLSVEKIFDAVRALMPPDATKYIPKTIEGSALLKTLQEHFKD